MVREIGLVLLVVEEASLYLRDARGVDVLLLEDGAREALVRGSTGAVPFRFFVKSSETIVRDVP